MTPATRTRGERLYERLPRVRGEIVVDAPLSRLTWFGVGGPADILFKPADWRDLATFLSEKLDDIPVHLLGVGSNLLVRDGGVRGVVVRLGRSFADIAVQDNSVIAGAAALDKAVALAAAEAGIAGLEFLSGVPGTIGGAVAMNAGAYGSEIKDVIGAVKALSPSGHRMTLALADLSMTYRHTDVPGDWIFLSARLEGHPGDPQQIAEKMDAIRAAREDTQPVKGRTGGSTFQNPPGAKAWELIDAAGCRGLRIGGAQISEKHCNFIINDGHATAADIEALGEEVRRRVRDASGVDLKWEIRRLGAPLETDPEAPS